MLEEIGRRPGGASQEEEGHQQGLGASSLHKVSRGAAGARRRECFGCNCGTCPDLGGSLSEPKPVAFLGDFLQGVTQDREGYALAAGLALGLITLGRGRAAVGLADLHLEDKLR